MDTEAPTLTSNDVAPDDDPREPYAPPRVIEIGVVTSKTFGIPGLKLDSNGP